MKLKIRDTSREIAGSAVKTGAIDPAVGEIPTPVGLSQAERPAWLRAAFAGAWSDIQGDLDYDLWRRTVAAAVAGRARSAVFSHFVAINAVLSVLSGDERVIGFRPDHTSVTTLQSGEGGLRLIERGHEAATGVL